MIVVVVMVVVVMVVAIMVVGGGGACGGGGCRMVVVLVAVVAAVAVVEFMLDGAVVFIKAVMLLCVENLHIKESHYSRTRLHTNKVTTFRTSTSYINIQWICLLN